MTFCVCVHSTLTWVVGEARGSSDEDWWKWWGRWWWWWRWWWLVDPAIGIPVARLRLLFMVSHCKNLKTFIFQKTLSLLGIFHRTSLYCPGSVFSTSFLGCVIRARENSVGGRQYDSLLHQVTSKFCTFSTRCQDQLFPLSCPSLPTPRNDNNFFPLAM